MKSILKITIAIILFMCMGCNKKEEDNSGVKQSTESNCITAKATTINYTDKITAVGILSNKDEYNLSFMVGGVISYLEVNEGDFVQKGKVLAKINQTSVQVTTNRLKLSYEKSKRDYERIENLYKDKVVTLEDFQNAKTGLDNAKLQLESAQFSQQYATIKAPSSGIIQSIRIHKNEMTSAGTTVLTLGSTKGGKVLKTNVVDIDVVKINMNDPCSITFDAFPNMVFKGHINEISGIADRYTGTYEIEIYVEDKDNKLKSGFIGTADILSAKAKEYLQIPIEALVSADKMIGEIYVLEGEEKKPKTIKIVKIFNDRLLVSEGLSENEEVIIN